MWVESQELFESLPYTKTFHHFGSRITFDKKGYMFFSVGERGMEKVFPQETDNDNGKIHRLNDDGSVPKDNPFVGKDPVKFHPSIYSYGQRNPSFPMELTMMENPLPISRKKKGWNSLSPTLYHRLLRLV
jgi:glucose/arabinose dehydrogenase